MGSVTMMGEEVEGSSSRSSSSSSSGTSNSGGLRVVGFGSDSKLSGEGEVGFDDFDVWEEVVEKRGRIREKKEEVVEAKNLSGTRKKIEGIRVFLNGGILIGYISNYAFSKLPLRLGWRLMLGVGAIPSILLAVAVLAMPESPRWLVAKGRLGEAKNVLNKISDSKEEARLRLADIKETAGIPLDCDDDVVSVTKQVQGKGVWKELFLYPTPAVRHIFIASLGIHFFAQATGIDAVVLYSPRIFEKAGIKSDRNKLLATIAVGFVKTIFILVATFLLDRVGRRVLLLTSVGGLILSLLTLAVSLTIIDHSRATLTWAIGLSIAAVLSYVGTFSIGSGPITWVYSSEIFPLRLRAQGVSIGAVVNRITSGVISMTFLSLSKAITIGGAFFLFAGIAIAAWVFHYTLLPETRGKTLEEIEGSFGNFWRKANASASATADGANGNNGNSQIQLSTNGKTLTTTD